MADASSVRQDRATRRSDRTHDEPTDLAPDLFGVTSRVSWSAIVAGAVIALACYTALTFLFAAIGITMADLGARGRGIGYGALAAAIFTIVVSLFIGGWVASQMTVGENRQEAVIYGLLTWGVVTAVSLWMVAAGVRAGYFAAVGGSVITQNNDRIPAWEDAALQAGVPQQQINEWKAKADPARVRAEANDPANQERAGERDVYSLGRAGWIAPLDGLQYRRSTGWPRRGFPPLSRPRPRRPFANRRSSRLLSNQSYGTDGR